MGDGESYQRRKGTIKKKKKADGENTSQKKLNKEEIKTNSSALISQALQIRAFLTE